MEMMEQANPVPAYSSYPEWAKDYPDEARDVDRNAKK